MRSSLLGGTFLTLTCLLSSPAIPCPAVYSDEELSDDLEEVGDQIELLWSGTEDERWAIALEPWPRFAPWRRPIDPQDRPLLVRQVDSLRRWILVESDDGIVRGVLSELAYFDLRELSPLFLEALDHPSPNVRWIAIERFVRFPDPQTLPVLVALWRDEPRPRLRVALALALAAQGRSEARVWRAWLADSRPTIVEAGLRALAAVSDERALPDVLRLATDANSPVREEAVALLPDWPASDAVVDALLAASTEGGDLGTGVAVALARLGDTRANDRIIELLAEDTERVGRVLMALNDASRPPAPELLDRVEARFPDTLAELRELGVWDAEPVENDTSPPREETSGIEPLHRDPDYDGTWRVRAPAGFEGIRCFVRPGVAMPAALYGRVPDRTDVDRVLDVFERGDGTWVWILSGRRSCWVPDSDIERRDPGDYSVGTFSNAAAREFDVPIEELASRTFRELEASGWIEAFDLGPDIAGVRVRDPIGDSPAVDAWLDAIEDEERTLDAHLLAILSEIAPGERVAPDWRTVAAID